MTARPYLLFNFIISYMPPIPELMQNNLSLNHQSLFVALFMRCLMLHHLFYLFIILNSLLAGTPFISNNYKCVPQAFSKFTQLKGRRCTFKTSILLLELVFV
jgi:hypothetical protein